MLAAFQKSVSSTTLGDGDPKPYNSIGYSSIAVPDVARSCAEWRSIKCLNPKWMPYHSIGDAPYYSMGPSPPVYSVADRSPFSLPALKNGSLHQALIGGRAERKDEITIRRAGCPPLYIIEEETLEFYGRGPPLLDSIPDPLNIPGPEGTRIDRLYYTSGEEKPLDPFIPFPPPKHINSIDYRSDRPLFI